MNKKIFLMLFLGLFLFNLVPTIEGHFFELHSLQTQLSCQNVDTPTASRLCAQYEDVMVACNLAADWAVTMYFVDDGKFYRFTHSRQFYNNLLANAGGDDKLRACATAVGLHSVQDVTSHGFVDAKGEIVQGYVGQTLKKFFITNALGHGPTERNMVNAVLEMDSFNYKGKEVLITQKDKDDALYYRANGLNIFNSDPELVNFLVSGSAEIPKETIENAIGIVGIAVGGGKQESVFTDIKIPSWWWIFSIGILSVGVIMFILFGMAFFFARGFLVKSFILFWLFIFLVISILGFFATLGMINGKAYIYYENIIDFFAGFLTPPNPEAFLEAGVANSVDFLETGIHKYPDASGWTSLAKASRSSFIFLAVFMVSFIASSIFILSRLRRQFKGKRKIFRR